MSSEAHDGKQTAGGAFFTIWQIANRDPLNHHLIMHSQENLNLIMRLNGRYSLYSHCTSVQHLPGVLLCLKILLSPLYIGLLQHALILIIIIHPVKRGCD